MPVVFIAEAMKQTTFEDNLWYDGKRLQTSMFLAGAGSELASESRSLSKRNEGR